MNGKERDQTQLRRPEVKQRLQSAWQRIEELEELLRRSEKLMRKADIQRNSHYDGFLLDDIAEVLNGGGQDA